MSIMALCAALCFPTWVFAQEPQAPQLLQNARQDALLVTDATVRSDLLLEIARLQRISNDRVGAAATARMAREAWPENLPQSAANRFINTPQQAQEAMAELSLATPAARVVFVTRAAQSAFWCGAERGVVSTLYALAVREAAKEPKRAARLALLGEVAAPNHAEADVHVVVAARRLLGLPDAEATAGEAPRRVQQLITDPELRHPRVFHALIRLARSEARRAQTYRPLRRLAIELPVSEAPYPFAPAMQARREAGRLAGNTLASKANDLISREAHRTPLTPDWRLRFSRQLEGLPLMTSEEDRRITFIQETLKEANDAWRPQWQPLAAPASGDEVPRLVTRLDPVGSLMILRRDINALVAPPAYVQNSAQRDTLLSRQANRVGQTFEQFLEELPFMVLFSSTFEDYHPDREPLYRYDISPVGKAFYAEVEKELARLPAGLQEELRPQFLIAKYATLLLDRRGELLRAGILEGLSGEKLPLVQRFAYLVARQHFNRDKTGPVLQALLQGRPPADRARIRLAFWQGLQGERWGQPEPLYVNPSVREQS